MHSNSIYYSSNGKFFLSIGPVNSIIYTSERIVHITNKLAFSIVGKEEKLPKKIVDLIGENYDIKEYFPQQKIKVPLKTIHLDLTDYCNYKCKNCYHSNKNYKLVAEESILEKISNISYRNTLRLHIAGGEPLLFPKSSLIQYLDRWGSEFERVKIFTNGAFLDEDIINICIERNITINLTFYSIVEEKHDEYTGRPGSFKALLSKVDYFIEREYPIILNLILDKEDMLGYRNDSNSIFHKIPFKKNVQLRKPTCRNDVELVDGQTFLSPVKNKPIMPTTCFKESVNFNLMYHPCFTETVSIAVDGGLYNCPWSRGKCFGNVKDLDFDTTDFNKLLCWERPFVSKYPFCRCCEFNIVCFCCEMLDKITEDIKNIDYPKKPYSCKYNPHSGCYDESSVTEANRNVNRACEVGSDKVEQRLC